MESYASRKCTEHEHKYMYDSFLQLCCHQNAYVEMLMSVYFTKCFPYKRQQVFFDRRTVPTCAQFIRWRVCLLCGLCVPANVNFAPLLTYFTNLCCMCVCANVLINENRTTHSLALPFSLLPKRAHRSTDSTFVFVTMVALVFVRECWSHQVICSPYG